MKAVKKFESEESARLFVAKCEQDFENRLSSAVESVCADKSVRLIALSGPSCSGKTTTASKLIQYMTEHGRCVHVVSIDDFYLDREVLLARMKDDPEGDIDYDSEDTIDFDALAECVAEIFSDDATLVPKFDFITGKRSGYVTIDPDENDLFIFEGIQAIYPKVTSLFHKYNYRSVYICVESGLDMEGTVFAPNDLRLMRRLVRDYNFRGATPEFTLYLWESVRANEELNIFPNATDCDFYINSTLPFEVNLLAPYLRKILPKVPTDNKYRKQAEAILAKLEGVEPVSKDMLREQSLCYEFIEK